MITVEYNVAVDDLLAFNFRAMRRSAFKGIFIWLALEILIFVSYVPSGNIAGAVLITLIVSSIFFLMPLSLLYPKGTAYGALIFVATLMLYALFVVRLEPSGALALLVPLVLVLLSSFYGLGISRMYKGNDSMIGKHILTIGESGVEEKTPNSVSRYEWSAVTSIEEDGRNMYLFLGRLKAFVIPKSSTSTNVEDFLKRARQYQSANAGSTS